MVGTRLGLSIAFLLVASAVEAQPVAFTGMLTGHVGTVANGDVRDSSVVPGVSMAVLDGSGLGAEFDFGYSGDFDNDNFADSNIGTLMLNFVAMRPHTIFRPFLVAGVGVIQTHVEFFDQVGSITQNDAGWNVGGGAHFRVNDALGFRGDMRYFRHFSRQTDIPVDGVFDFVRYSFGVTFSWPMR